MLKADSLVADFMFSATGEPDMDKLVEAIGGPDVLADRTVIDPDMQDPQFEMQVSPSRPFRRRDERRLMVIDDSVAPLRDDPENQPIIERDLTPYLAMLLAACEAVPEICLARLFALGSPGDAIIIAHNLIDIRALCLVPWALNPAVDVSGRQRGTPLSQAEFEEKLIAYDKRLEELTEARVRENITSGAVTEFGDLVVASALDANGHWDQRVSIAMEAEFAAIELFSMLPGAPHADGAAPGPAPAQAAAHERVEQAEQEIQPPRAAEPTRPPIAPHTLAGRVLLVLPPERFSLEVAAAIGKNDWSSVLQPGDNLDGPQRDMMYDNRADFVAPVEFLSEVFVDGVPLTKPQFRDGATDMDGTQVMVVHFPRLGPVQLLQLSDGRRYVCSTNAAIGNVLSVL